MPFYLEMSQNINSTTKELKIWLFFGFYKSSTDSSIYNVI